MNDCIICHKPLPVWFKGDICSGKCRQKKSRDKLEAPSKAHKISFEIDAIARVIRLNNMSKSDAQELLWTINRSVHALWDQIEALPDKPAGKP